MVDAEVIRLRRLRRAALLARRLALNIQTKHPGDSTLARSAVVAWSVARLINGRLGSHPNLSCQQAAAPMQTMLDSRVAAARGFIAVKRGKPYGLLAEQLQMLSRELDDARALTRSADLSDALGRAQWQLSRALQELRVGARREPGAKIAARGEAAAVGAARPADWPYLAI